VAYGRVGRSGEGGSNSFNTRNGYQSAPSTRRRSDPSKPISIRGGDQRRRERVTVGRDWLLPSSLQHRQESHRGSGPEAGSTIEVITYPIREILPFAPLGILGRSLAINFSPLSGGTSPSAARYFQSVVLGITAQDESISENTIGHGVWTWYGGCPREAKTTLRL
ncbi:hypothetical protein BO85DRAFT_524237, partial [Aspergillus piperis CBS 112811]